MKLLFSVPTGYHLRELVLPLKNYLEADTEIEDVVILTPAADKQEQIFSTFTPKFSYYTNPASESEHTSLLKKLAPDVVITNTVGHDKLDYPILKAASQLGIPTLTFIASWDNVWKIGRLMRDNVPIHIADHLIVWNQMMEAHLHRLFPDFARDRISIIGAPRLDYFWQKNSIPTKQETYNLLGFSDTSKPFIHFATTELYPMNYIIEAVSRAMKRGLFPEAYLYASVHPGGDITKHESLKSLGVTVRYSFGRSDNPPHPSFAYLPTETDTQNLVGVFMHAGVLVNQSSTTALESLIAGVPVINVMYGRKFDWWKWYRSMVYRDFKQHYVDLVRDGATYMVKNEDALIDSLKHALEHPEEKREAAETTIKRMITTIDGTASQKVLTKIKKSAKKP